MAGSSFLKFCMMVVTWRLAVASGDERSKPLSLAIMVNTAKKINSVCHKSIIIFSNLQKGQ